LSTPSCRLRALALALGALRSYHHLQGRPLTSHSNLTLNSRKMLRTLLVLSLSVMLSGPVLSAEPDIDQLKAALAKTFPDTDFSGLRLTPSAIPSLYEVDLGGQIFYVSADGKHLLVGDMIEINTHANLTERRRERVVLKLFDEVGDQNMILMGPDNPKRTITVFTDVDCQYCAKLHLDVPELTKHGVKVRYLLYPRNGLESETYKRSVAVWCAADRVKAVGIAKAGGKVEMKTCNNPVSRIYSLGVRLGISGTPTIFLDNGKRVPGYVPPDRLLAMLGLKAAPRAATTP